MNLLVANSKGGVGKTTTAVTLAHALSYQRLNVLLVDLDAQGHVALSLGLKRSPDVYELFHSGEIHVKRTGRKGLYIIPGDERTAWVANTFAGRPSSHLVLKKALATVESHFDVVVIDTPPGISPLTETAIHWSTHVLIPVACEAMGLDGLMEYSKALAEAIAGDARTQLGWVVPTMYDRVRNTTGVHLEAIYQHYPDHTTAPIPRESKMAEAPRHGQTIWEYAPRSRSARAYAMLAKKVMEAI